MTYNLRMKEISEVLTQGLLKGYAGGAPQDVTRGGFSGKVSEPVLDEGEYHDEWFGSRSGGGQELISIDDHEFTRLYGGGTPDVSVLKSLGITEDEVGTFLVKMIKELEDRTRLFEDCLPDPDGDWQYSYRILDREDSIGVVMAKEKIDYKQSTVFVHNFILSPII